MRVMSTYIYMCVCVDVISQLDRSKEKGSTYVYIYILRLIGKIHISKGAY